MTRREGLRMTRREGLRMTRREGLRMTRWEGLRMTGESFRMTQSEELAMMVASAHHNDIKEWLTAMIGG